MFLSFSKKGVLVFLIVATLFFSFGFLLSVIAKEQTFATPYNLTIVLDAGHGGIDGGSVGKNGTVEAELNLVYVNKLEKLFKSANINVVKTRKSPDGLYTSKNGNFKKEDMQKRKQIIENADAQAVVSIHMNKFSLNSERGCQVFYQKESESGKNLAESIKNSLTKQIDYSRELTLAGDYFICKCADIPSVIVECGFLSNDEEEKLLNTDDYQDKLCYAIFCGVLSYFVKG